MKHPLLRSLCCLSTLVVAMPSLADTASINNQYASFVVLGQSPSGSNVAIARTVIDPQLDCPTISEVGGSQTSNMVTRDNSFHFPVMVCEGLVAFDKSYQLNFSDGTVVLPSAKSNPSHIQVFGDTGCKSKDCPSGSAAQPFQALADSGALAKPDLVLHMGDFNYRGTGGQVGFSAKDSSGQLQQQNQWTYDAGDDLGSADHCGQSKGQTYYSQNAANANRPDSWNYWLNDLFMSAKSLMLAAPWIVARGNHELCSRAGPGYFYFLDPHSNLVKGQQQLSCPMQNADKSALANTVQIPNYTVSFKTLDIAVIDSANACDSYSNSPFTKIYQQVFKRLNHSAKQSGNNTWVMTHRPIWGVQEYDSSTGTPCTANKQYGCVNQMMQKAIAMLPGKRLVKNISLVLSGHMHKFESISFAAKNHPPALIIGSSGVKLAGSQPQGAGKTQINGIGASVLTTNTSVHYKGSPYAAFGFLKMQLAQDGSWQGQLVNPSSNLLLANCTSEQNLAQGVCELGPDISVSSSQ